ncbi:MAG: SURF1 family protein [Aliishimia sp.]
MQRILFPVVIGLGGLAILLYLGTWQVQRLGWKQGLLADIDASIVEAPVQMPASPNSDRDRYLPVTVSGTFTKETPFRMLASRRQIGAVFRHIAQFETEAGRRILIDIGWTTSDQSLPALPSTYMSLTGNLDWPRESDGFTPEPDLNQGLWYARDLDEMAKVAGADPILVVLRDMPDTSLGATPWPVDTAGISNDHLQYAITWFSLAVVWIAMTALFTLRLHRKPNES